MVKICIYLTCVLVFYLHIVCILCTCSDSGDQKRSLDLKELKLQMTMRQRWCWEPNMGPLQKQQLLLATETGLQCPLLSPLASKWQLYLELIAVSKANLFYLFYIHVGSLV